MKQNKVCIECNKDLARYWGRNFCESCFRQLLTEHLKEEDKLHAEKMNLSKVNS